MPVLASPSHNRAGRLCGALVILGVPILLAAGCGQQSAPRPTAGPSLPVNSRQAASTGPAVVQDESPVPAYVLSPATVLVEGKQGTIRKGPLPSVRVKAKDASRNAISVHPFNLRPALVETQPVSVGEGSTKFVVYVTLQTTGATNGAVFSLSADGKPLAQLDYSPEMTKERKWQRLEGDITSLRGKKAKFRLTVDSKGDSHYDWAYAAGFSIE